MKFMMKLSLAVVALLAATTVSNAQPKFGFVNTKEIVFSMPEIAEVQASLEKLQKDLEEQTPTEVIFPDLPEMDYRYGANEENLESDNDNQ